LESIGFERESFEMEEGRRDRKKSCKQIFKIPPNLMVKCFHNLIIWFLVALKRGKKPSILNSKVLKFIILCVSAL
jgi:hypothetical protein